MNVNERVQSLRKIMKDNGISAYIVPSADYHQSEYVGEHFKCRRFISGFTGSAGTAVILENSAGLWTDGRYFIQAEREIEGSGLDLFRMGEEGVPTYEEYLYDNLKDGDTLGFYGKAIASKEGIALKNKFEAKGIKLSYDTDLVDKVWEDRPDMENEKVFMLDEKYAGESVVSKLERLKKAINEKGATVNVISSLDDIAWLFNIRGADVPYHTVTLSYAAISDEYAYLFINKSKLDDAIISKLENDGVTIKAYDEIDSFLKGLENTEKVLLELAKTNYYTYESINANIEKIDALNPTSMFKACKNETELENLRNAHLKDGVVVTKFMYWLKTNVGKETITEFTAGNKMEEFRREQEGFLKPSFGTIAAYRGNAAMAHYSASEDTALELEPKDLYLIDSGGQYLDGTTDITRTMCLGELSDEIKDHFTLVLKGMLDLSTTKFLYGATGHQLDAIARRPLWNFGINYNHGTGHGIGFVLNVHEGPHSIRFQQNPVKLEHGMVVSNEPGVYVENSHGIRIENEIIVKRGVKTDFGQFMEFEVLTYAPIDLDAINISLLNEEEKAYLNWYHKMVFDKVSPYLNEEELAFVKEYTKAI